MARVYNFSAGPAVLPEPVLAQVRDELLDWHGSGMSVMEMSHRGKEFIEIQGQAEADLRMLMGIPANYKVLFLQGGASLQFSMVPLNLLPAGGKADYVLTGAWAKKAASEAKRYGTVNVAATSAETNFNRIPTQAELKLDPGAAYVHITGNNTIFGTEYHYTPDTGAVPLVNDASSNILSRPVDVSRYGLIYAGAQKNIGPAGVTLNPATPMSLLQEILGDVDLVLIMSVNPGFGGQSFIPSVLKKIAEARRMLDQIKSQALLEVDGGVKADNAREIVAAGATVLVAGSAIFAHRDYTATIAAMRAAAEKAAA